MNQLGAILSYRDLVEVDQLSDLLADRICEDQLRSDTLTFIELSTEASQLTHDLNKVALSLGMLIIYLLLLF